MITNLIDNGIDELQSTFAGIDGLIFDSIYPCFKEKNQILIRNDFIGSQLCEYAEHMRPTKWTFVIDSLQKSSDKLLLRIFVHFLVACLREYVF